MPSHDSRLGATNPAVLVLAWELPEQRLANGVGILGRREHLPEGPPARSLVLWHTARLDQALVEAHDGAVSLEHAEEAGRDVHHGGDEVALARELAEPFLDRLARGQALGRSRRQHERGQRGGRYEQLRRE